MKKIIIATKNEGKVREMKDAFSAFKVEVISLKEFGNLPDAVEDGKTFEENAKKKAAHYAALTKTACLADDSGLEVEVLNNAPGVYSARWGGENATDEINNEKLIAEIKRLNKESSLARYRCALAFMDTDNSTLLTEGKAEGEIRFTAKGKNGFGYDPYFYVGDITMAEMSLEEKNKISHRGTALKAMIELLEEKGIIERK